ncbi:hypothetical protein KSP40_PGU007714 [Platanthera guangdongensis]|uniref:Uncharacterized protein n=1 Tax=Platanthera guangdongensis TaxID=2320717 RepID=A0ABR2MIQ9_9ASPA
MCADRRGGERAPMSRAADVPIKEKPNPSPFRCPHCAGPLSKNLIGSGVGGIASAFYGFNHGYLKTEEEDLVCLQKPTMYLEKRRNISST